MPSSAPHLGGGAAVDLDADVFEQPFNGPLVHEVVIAELAARRQGTHATKTRGMVSRRRREAVAPEGHRPRPRRHVAARRSGPAAAPSSARARATTSSRSTARRAAPRCAPRCRCTPSAATIHVVDAAAFDAPSTAKAAELLHAHRGGSVLVALADDELTAAKSFRNLSRVIVLHVDDVGVADLVARGDARRSRRRRWTT